MASVVKKQKKESELEKMAVKMTEWVGTPTSIIVHSILFALAFAVVRRLFIALAMILRWWGWMARGVSSAELSLISGHEGGDLWLRNFILW